uniref:Glycosyltransferase family 92 protein n=1 Tax=Caenorhabditis tropicalis TaxID=1561998 RepID=A0A1I7UIL2_9PELO
MEGATFFYFHIGKISDYDRRILDEYVNQGDAEVKTLQEKYERPFYGWQLIEIQVEISPKAVFYVGFQDCHMRSKYHSKWTAFIDIDERIHTNEPDRTLIDILGHLDSQNIAEIQLAHLKVIKDGETPRKYIGKDQISRELFSRKYVNTSEPTFQASKAVIRPDKVGIMSIHYAVALEYGWKSVQLDSDQVAFRHYRDVLHRVSGNDWAENETMSENPLTNSFNRELTKRVTEKLEFVYRKVPVNCSTIPDDLYKSRAFPNPCEKMLETW